MGRLRLSLNQVFNFGICIGLLILAFSFTIVTAKSISQTPPSSDKTLHGPSSKAEPFLNATATDLANLSTAESSITPIDSNTSTSETNPLTSVGTQTVNNEPVVTSSDFSASPGVISATVTNEGTPATGAWIVALRKSDFKMAAGAIVDDQGNANLTVAAGTYYLYIVDPDGRFAFGFSGNPPQVVQVLADSTTAVQVATTSTKGKVEGTVTDDQGNPIANAWVLVLTTDFSSPRYVQAVLTTDENGHYESDLLTPGDYYIGWVDPSGQHQAQFAPRSNSIPESTPVEVKAGQSLVLGGQLPIIPLAVGASQISGIVTSTSGSPIANARVVALSAKNYALTAGTTADQNGIYNLSVPDGEYKLAFIDPTGLHKPEWFSDTNISDLASAGSVSSQSSVSAALDPVTGSLTGVVRDSQSQLPVAGAWIVLANSGGPVKGVSADSSGAFTIDELSPGQYYVIVVDPSGARVANTETSDASQMNIAGSVDISAGSTSLFDPGLSTPQTTNEVRMGQPLEEFPFPIMIDPPHRPHYPVTDFAEVTYDKLTGYNFVLPEVTSEEGLYGRFWLSPEPPTPGAQLAGVRYNDVNWQGTTTNSIVVFSLLDRQTEDNGLGKVTGATQGLENQLVCALFEHHADSIEMRFNDPVSYSGNRFVAAIDSESLPMGQDGYSFPDSISVGSIEWLWTAPN